MTYGVEIVIPSRKSMGIHSLENKFKKKSLKNKKCEAIAS